jgi:hypothetical protein
LPRAAARGASGAGRVMGAASAAALLGVNVRDAKSEPALRGLEADAPPAAPLALPAPDEPCSLAVFAILGGG